MKCFFYLTVFVVVFSLATQPSHAKNPPASVSGSAAQSHEKSEASEPSWISNGKELGDWWNRNAKKYDPIPEPLLYHFDGKFSITKVDGNVEADNRTLNATLFLRKNIFSSVTGYTLSKNETTISLFPDNTTTVESKSLNQSISMALTDRLNAYVGYLWLTDYSAKYIDERTIVFGGLSASLFELPKFTMAVIAAYGEVEIDYMNESFEPYPGFTPIETYESGAVYFQHNMNWQITDMISFSDTCYYLYCQEDSEYYTWKADLTLSFRLTAMFSFFTNYSIEYDNNSFVEGINDYLRAANMNGRLEKIDKSLTVGINIAF